MLPDLQVRQDYLNGWTIQNITGGKEIRFSTAMYNGGVGAFEMRGTQVYVTNPDGTQKQAVNQRIYNNDATFTDVPSGFFTYHSGHGHIHFDDMAQSRLRLRPADQSVGAIVVESEKTSFCLIDIDHYQPGLPGSPANSVYNSCNPTYQGISVGWNDVYSSGLEGQSIPLIGVPPGNYWLEVECDPLNVVQETVEGNNVTRVAITISSAQLPTIGFRILSGTPTGASAAPANYVDFNFNMAVDPTTVTAAGFSLTGPSGTIPVTGVQQLSNTKFRASFAQQGAVGTYTMTVSPVIKNTLGAYLDQNNNGTGNEVADQFFNIFTIVSPKIVASTPSGQTTTPVTSVRLTYNKTMDSSTFTMADIVSFTGPGGVDLMGQILSVVPVTPGPASAVFDVNFTSQGNLGNYSLVVGPDVRDAEQNLVDQNSDGFTNTTADRFTASFAAGVVGPDTFGYVAMPDTFQNIDLVGQTGIFTIHTSADNASVAVNLGTSTFTFYGTTYTGASSLFVSTNGLITFGSSNTSASNGAMSTISQPAIAVLWDDWRAGTGNPEVLGKFFDDNTDGINDRLVVQWNKQYHSGSTAGTITYHAILELNTGAVQGKIVANYPDADSGDAYSNGAFATVGVKATGTGGSALQVLSNNVQFLIGSGKAFQFTVPTVTSITRMGTNPVDAGATVDYLITFNQPINPVNLDQTDFTLTATGGLTGYNVAEIHPTATPYQYEVHVNTGVGNGTLRLNFIDDNTVSSFFGPKVGGVGLNNANFSKGEIYTVVQQPPEINRVAIDNDSGQRSQVRSVTVYFDRVVTFAGAVSAAFAVNGPGGAVPFTFDTSPSTPTFTAVKLNFTGSVPDGNYTITVFGNQASTGGVLLNGDGTGPGTNYSDTFHRFFGDADGDGAISAYDFIQFRLAFSGTDPIFDFDGDGAVSASDFVQFRLRFGGSI